MPGGLLVAAGAAHGVALQHGKSVAHAVIGGEADAGGLAAEHLVIIHVEKVGAGEGGHAEHLLALGHPVGRAVLGGVFVVIVVGSIRELLAEFQYLDKILAVKIAGAGGPVHIVGHIQGQANFQHGVPVHTDVNALAALRHGGQSGVIIVIGPARGVPHHAAGAHGGVHRKAGAGGVELAVQFHGGEHVGEEVPPAQLLVGVNIGVEVLQQALGRQLAVGDGLRDRENIRHVAGHDLRGQLGEAGRIVVLRVVLGVVLHIHTVFVVGTVEVDDGLLGVVVQVHHRHTQALLMGHGVIGDFGDGHILKAVVIRSLVIIADEAFHHAVLPDGDQLQRIAVHVAADPVEEHLGALLRQLIAVEMGAGAVIQVVVPAAGDHLVHIPVQGVGLAFKAAGGAVDDAQGHGLAVVGGAHVIGIDAHPAVLQLGHGVDPAVKVNLVSQAAVRLEGQNAALPGGYQVALLIQLGVIGIEVVRVLQRQLAPAQLGAGLIQGAEVIGGIIQHIVEVIRVAGLDVLRGFGPGGIDTLQHHEIAFLIAENFIDALAGVEIPLALTVHLRRHRGIGRQRRNAAVQAAQGQAGLHDVILALVFRRRALGNGTLPHLFPVAEQKALVTDQLRGVGNIAFVMYVFIFRRIDKVRGGRSRAGFGLTAAIVAFAAGAETESQGQHQQQSQAAVGVSDHDFSS